MSFSLIVKKEISCAGGADADILRLREAFVGHGSVSVNSGYHLEIAALAKDDAVQIIDILEKYLLKANMVLRKDKYVVYIKGAQGVSDMLALMGASKAVLELNSNYVDKQVKQLANRRSNCDLANIDKSVLAGLRQFEAIKRLQEQGKLETLDKKLKQAAELRIENPEMSLTEIAALAGISKSGMSHRLNKLIELAT